MSLFDEHPTPWRTAYAPGDDLAHVVDANDTPIMLDDPYDDRLDVIVAAVNTYASRATT